MVWALQRLCLTVTGIAGTVLGLQSSLSLQRMAALEEAKSEAFWGLFIGDALAMPVHWYYNPQNIKRDFGQWLDGYAAPQKVHPTSIMSLSAVDGSGRGGATQSQPVIGHVILHDKLEYWQKGKAGTHYHQGMAPGDNTLNALTALQTARTLQREDPDGTGSPEGLRAAALEDYVRFLTTPGSHNDTYAESCHRAFFKDWVTTATGRPTTGEELLRFTEKRYDAVVSGSEDHQLVVVGSLVLAIPWVLHHAHRSEDECARVTVEALKMTTHPAPSLEPFVEVYARLLHSVVNGADLKVAALKALEAPCLGGRDKKRLVESIAQDASKLDGEPDALLELLQDAVSRLGSACYIQGAMSSLLLLAHTFHDDPVRGMLFNANCGGENAHRGAALGALLGANTRYTGTALSARWKQGLHSAREDIAQTTLSKL